MVEELALLDGILRLKGPFMVEVEIPWWFQGRVVGTGEGLVGFGYESLGLLLCFYQHLR